jgi:hypothetical protein
VVAECAEGEAARPDPVAIAYGPPRSIGECEILAWDMESQLARRIPGREARTYRMPHLAEFVPSTTVPRPRLYLGPGSLATKLEDHGIQFLRLSGSRPFAAELDRVETVSKISSPDAGTMKREETVVTVSRIRGTATAEAGDVLVPIDQTLGTLAVYLLEPESDDGLVRWGYLDTHIRPGETLPIARIDHL